jgi:outer membrane protein OmpA-like peptidoglycan-associated protein
MNTGIQLLTSAAAAMAATLALGCTPPAAPRAEHGPNGPNGAAAQPQVHTPARDRVAPPAPTPAADPQPDLRVTAVVLDAGLAELCGVDQARAHFDFDSAELDEEGRRVVRELADCLERGALAQQQIAIIGHTDPRGPDEYNLALGMSRAESVAQVLVGNNIARDRIEVMTQGDVHADHEEPERWPLDRRVDIRVVGP